MRSRPWEGSVLATGILWYRLLANYSARWERIHENHRADRSSSARPCLLRVRTEWLPAFHPWAHTSGNSGSVRDGSFPVALLRCYIWRANPWRGSSTGEPLRTTGADDPWPGDREHFELSLVHVAERAATRTRSYDRVGFS